MLQQEVQQLLEYGHFIKGQVQCMVTQMIFLEHKYLLV